jgi:formate hydrogenlyase subunit 4
MTLAKSLIHPILALILAPLMLGVINRTKSILAGREGPPLAQPYYDLRKLLGKGAVYSRTTTWIFRAGPMIGLASIVVALLVVPFGSCPAPLAFSGDLILFAYLLGLARLCTVLAALDTGSAFEGMGASREVLFSALAEPALLLGLAAVARQTRTLSLTAMQAAQTLSAWSGAWLPLTLVAVALGVVLLSENSRIPVDDPNTHLELTMIHEVMVLDHGGPDFAFIIYGAALKMWALGALLIGLVLPFRIGMPYTWPIDVLISLANMLAVAVGVGVVESTMARVRMPRIPQLLIFATTLSTLALVFEYGGMLR